ncbi:MAG: penicillin-binding protein 2 [bacterium]
MFRNGDRSPRPSQFAFRVALLGGGALVLFAIVFFRLWYLEVLSGDRYLAEANNNQVREVTVQAPRGEIVDRDGKVLVDNRTALALQVRTTELPRGNRVLSRELRSLGQVAGMSKAYIERQIRKQTRESPASPVTLRRDVPYDLVYYLRENQGEFPGVSVDRVYVRQYPQGALGAHMFGYVREVNPDQLDDPRFESLEPGDEVGQAGVESTYDSLLRGVKGTTRIQVDASGRPTGGRLSVRRPEAGNNLRMTLDSGLQSAAEAAMARFGLPGGFVAMDVDTGEVLALGSVPSFDPSVFAKPVIPPAIYDQLTTGTDAPIFDRSIQGGYPTGSTFKLLTATAALEDGAITPEEIVDDPGVLEVGGVKFENAGDAINGPINLQTALQVSSDVYFYKLGLELNADDNPEGGALQNWARQLGMGSRTGIDLPSEAPGLVPTPGWRDQLYADQLTDRSWTVGDNINLAVGQGDLQATPLQLAVAYATLANGGSVVRPHVGMRVEDPSGGVIQEIDPAPRREVSIDPETRRSILDGLHAAAQEPGGTSYGVFGGFPVDIAGKTGTAERGLAVEDQSWYVALAPYPDPEIVVVATLERGGFGADSAAPAVQEILSEYFNVKPEKIEQVTDPTATVYE